MSKINKYLEFINLHKLTITLILCFLLFNAFAITRLAPVNSLLEINNEQVFGDHDRKVYRVFNLAQENANKSFMQDFDNFLFHGRNPGLFLFTSEVFIRLGAKSPTTIQILSIIMFNIGLFFAYRWIRILFNSKRIATISILFLVTTPYLLYHSVSIHVEPYEFLFFNLTIFGYLKFLTKEPQQITRKYLGVTLAAFFILTQNYYMFYMSTFIFILGLHYHYRKKFFSKHLIAIAAIPLISVALVILQASLVTGGLTQGVESISEIAVARTVDARTPGSDWFPDRTFVTFDDYLHMPELISLRAADMFQLKPAAIKTANKNTSLDTSFDLF